MNANGTPAAGMGRAAGLRPRFLARATGASYLLTMAAGAIAQGLISARLVVTGDAAATAANVLAHPLLLQTGFAIYLIEMVCQVAMIALFYLLLRPAGRSVSLLAACVGLTGAVVKTFTRLFFIAPLFVLGGAPYMNVFDTKQLQALALLFFKINDHGAAIALVFFGFYAILRGYLVLRSTFLPRFLGVLSMLAGAGLLCFLYQPLGYRAFPYIAGIGLLGAAAWIFWLLAFGVNERRWREQAAAGGAT